MHEERFNGLHTALMKERANLCVAERELKKEGSSKILAAFREARNQGKWLKVSLTGRFTAIANELFRDGMLTRKERN